MDVTTKTNCLKRQTPAKVWLGTSGYSFYCWDGAFYPPRLPKNKMLEYYASQFETVELNYSFYRLPTVGTSAAMVKKTPDDFRFFVKGSQLMTHEQNLSQIHAFKEGIRPIQESGKLSGLLFQFPQAFKNNKGNRAFLSRLAGAFQEYHLAIEFRDCSWLTDQVDCYFEDHNLSLVAVDEPAISTLFPRMAVATSDIGYVRLHSSDGSKWYAGNERYDYNYSREELEGWADMLGKIAQRSPNIFVYFNNCHRGQAAQNAKAMKQVIRDSGLDLEVVTIDRSVKTVKDGLWGRTG